MKSERQFMKSGDNEWGSCRYVSRGEMGETVDE